MIPLKQTGYISEGPLAGWYIKVQAFEVPSGFLVSRARNPEMDQTLILDGIFPTQEALEAFFQERAPKVEWPN